MNENFFYSLDKLVEFGLGTTVATQMIRSMNDSISNMTVPGAGNSPQGDLPQIYYVATNGKASGPYSITELARLIADGVVKKNTYIWTPGMSNWNLAENIPEILRLVAISPPQLHFE